MKLVEKTIKIFDIYFDALTYLCFLAALYRHAAACCLLPSPPRAAERCCRCLTVDVV